MAFDISKSSRCGPKAPPVCVHPSSFILHPFARTVLGVILLASGAALGFIDRKFTPIDVVGQAETIAAVLIRPAEGSDTWTLGPLDGLKGEKPAQAALRFSPNPPKDAEVIRTLLTHQDGVAGLLFSATQQTEKRAFLHVGVRWLELKAGLQDSAWEIVGFDEKMHGAFAGATEMLERMTRYILAEPDAAVPVSVGTRWMDRSRIGSVPGEIAGMAAIDLKGDGTMHLFVASSAGDRIFRPNKARDSLEDISAATRLDARSHRFAWIDWNRDGWGDLASWDGSILAVRSAQGDGTFAPADPASTYKLEGECLGLAPVSVAGDGAPALLVSTPDLPLLLGPAGKATPLPAGKVLEGAKGPPTACIVADLDNDGDVDVLQPRGGGGVLWKGIAGGFAEPVASAVTGEAGNTCFALGDFDGDGFLDIFLGEPQKNRLWENDGKGSFRPVIEGAGSLAVNAPPGVSDCTAADLNHDGRPDLALAYPDKGFIYHFNRGYRTFGEEGELQLTGERFPEALPVPGVKAVAAADFNGEGAHDLAVALTDGTIFIYYNDLYDEPGVAVRLAKGVTGPVSVSAWQGNKYPYCIGTLAVSGGSPASFFSTRPGGQCTLKYSLPGKPNLSKVVDIEDKPVKIVLGE